MRLRFKAGRKDGTHAVLLDPLDFIARLCALVPPLRFHMVRYHRVLAAHSSARAEVALGREPPQLPEQLPLFTPPPDVAPLATPEPLSRHPWAWLLRRVFAVDVTTCPRRRLRRTHAPGRARHRAPRHRARARGRRSRWRARPTSAFPAAYLPLRGQLWLAFG